MRFVILDSASIVRSVVKLGEGHTVKTITDDVPCERNDKFDGTNFVSDSNAKILDEKKREVVAELSKAVTLAELQEKLKKAAV